MKTLLVTGDLVWDTHIARLPIAAKGYFQPHLLTQLANQHGGAWYLGEAVEAALQVAGVSATVITPRRAGHEEIEVHERLLGIAKAFSVWKWHPQGKGGVWRIDEFLGCRAAPWDRNGQKTPKSLRAAQKAGNPPKNPDVLVLDDLGLGFASHPEFWPSCLRRRATPPSAIFLKATAPFDTPLHARLLAPDLAGRVTVILSSAAFRDAGALISKGLSWDQTLEEVIRNFRPGGAGWPLRHCHRVVIIFGQSGAAVFSRERQSPGEPDGNRLRFERFLYDPSHFETTWCLPSEGRVFGATSVMTAALVAAALQKGAKSRPGASANVSGPSSSLAVALGLAAGRELHRRGGGAQDSRLDLSGACAQCFHAAAKGAPLHGFLCAFNRELLDDPVLIPRKEMAPESLLTDVLGGSLEFHTVAAERVARQGEAKTLAGAPHLRCGKFFTVDREEIERLNMVRNLIEDYTRSPADFRPLSIAVFGPPGSGKSFAIKQLAGALFGEAKASLEFNLSQFSRREDLHEAFHDVRDRSVQGRIPLVFWDEFDSAREGAALGWLKEFLAPMQDAKFFGGGRDHPFGKCVFIFAGGTCGTFEEFDRSHDTRNASAPAFREAKGPDFVSRLRAYVNIKGPNQTGKGKDPVHVVRRALLLRELILRHHPGMLKPGSNELDIHPSVLSAFLRVERYLHGARSMEAIVSLSRLKDGRSFGPSELPPPEVIRLHVSPDFVKFCQDEGTVSFSEVDVERLAAIMHRNWTNEKKAQGWSQGTTPGRNPQAKTDSRLVPYAELAEPHKEANRTPARLTLLRLGRLGFQVRPEEVVDPALPVDLRKETAARHLIARTEHRRWMREMLLRGYAYAEQTDDGLLRHHDLVKFDSLPDAEARLDYGIADAIGEYLVERGLVLVRRET